MTLYNKLRWLLQLSRRKHHRRRPGPARHVKLKLTHYHSHKHRRGIMNDVTVTWDNTTVGTPTSYSVVWTLNGTSQPAVVVPVTVSQDQFGYSLDFVTSVPTVVLKAGDVLGATVQAVDGTNNLLGPVTTSVPATVTIPTVPLLPGAAQNVVLALS